eukprot:TRINITY_DN26429_c0_g1_i1.p1 TRINITY_DN26429_c0_g1~~TRINITY_DN26429_c0_g1_i1.p1  ORF type:complete len:395 (-),score=117.33 TRINITY_DN26429_c0_g1_i1:67-1251(-)
MVMIKGMGLDDLIGLTKLQDVLEAIIGRLDEQGETIKELRDGADATEKKLTEHDAIVAQVKTDCADAVSTVKGLQKEVAETEEKTRNQLEARAVPLEVKLRELEATVKANTGVEELRQNLQKQTAALQECQKALAALEKATEETAKQDEAKRRKLERAIEEVSDSCNGRLEEMEESAKAAAAKMAAQEQRLAEASETSQQALAQGTEARAAANEAAEGATSALERATALDALSKQLSDDLQELRLAIEKDEKMKGFADALGRLDASLKDLRSKDQGAALRSLIDALSDKEAADVMRLTKEINNLINKLSGFLDKGASATARCLSCFDRRSQMHNTIVVGSDGKTYLKSAEGVNIGRLNVPSGGHRGPSPPRIRAGTASPVLVRGGAGSLSASAL